MYYLLPLLKYNLKTHTCNEYRSIVSVAMDFMADWDVVDDPPVANALALDDSVVLLPIVHPRATSSQGALLHDTGSLQRKPSFSSLAGKVGHGRHGDDVEKALLTSHMRGCKAVKRNWGMQQDVCQTLAALQVRTKRSKIGLTIQGFKSRSFGIKLTLVKQATRGNRFTRSIPYSSFLEAAFGRAMRDNARASVLRVAPCTLKQMRVHVASSVMRQQARLLGRMVVLAKIKQPLACITRLKWDETSVHIKLNPGGQVAETTGTRSHWQVIVCRVSLALVWADGPSVQINLVSCLQNKSFV